MRLAKIVAVTLLLLLATGVASGELSDEHIELVVEQTELDQGDTLEARVDLSDRLNDTGYVYVFTLGDEEFQTDDPEFTRDVHDTSIDRLTVYVNDTETGDTARDSVHITVDEPDDEELCHEEFRDAYESAEETDLCTDETAEMQCPHDTSITRSATDGCIITELADQGWERVEDTDEDEDEDITYDVELSVSPTAVAHGEHIEATVRVNGEVRDDLEYEWNQRNVLTRDDELPDVSEPRITIIARDDGRTPEALLHVHVLDDGALIGRAEAEIEWTVYEPDVDGLDVAYHDSSIDVAMTEAELDDRPQFRAGTSLDAWDEIQLDGRHVTGGIEMELRELTEQDYETEDTLIPYAVVQITGENLDGLGLHITADVANDWLLDHDLIMTDRHADISFYRVDGSSWEQLPSLTTRSQIDDHVGLRSDPTRTSDRHEFHVSGDAVTIGIAGDPNGIDVGRFAVSPDDVCDELRDGEPVPGGWEEIDVPCDVHERVEHVEDRLYGMAERMDSDAEEVNIDLDARVSDIEQLIETYRLYEAEEEIEELQLELREAIREHRDTRTRDTPEDQQDEMEMQIQRQMIDRYPEELHDLYERPEHIQDLYDRHQELLEAGEQREAGELMQEIRDEKQDTDAYQRLERAGNIHRTIERLLDRDELDDDHAQDLEEAERLLLEEHDIDTAETMVEDVESDLQTARMRDAVRRMLQDPETRRMLRDFVISVIPGLG